MRIYRKKALVPQLPHVWLRPEVSLREALRSVESEPDSLSALLELGWPFHLLWPQRRTCDGEITQARYDPKAACAIGEPRRHRGLDPARDAGSASHRQAAGRVDLRDDPRASVRRQVEEGVLRVARTWVDHRDGRLRRLRECRLLRRRGIRPSAAAWRHRTDPLRQGDYAVGGAETGDAQVDRASRAGARLEVRIHEARTRPPRCSKLRPGTREESWKRNPPFGVVRQPHLLAGCARVR